MKTITITSVDVLVSVLSTAIKTAKGQWASIVYSSAVRFNQFPNEDYCVANGITLASGKGSKDRNEKFRLESGFSATRFVKAMFHIGYNYATAMVKNGFELPTEQNNEGKVRMGGSVTYYEPLETTKFGFVFAYYGKAEKGYFVGGRKATEKETAYIRGYRAKSNGYYNKNVDWRTPKVEDIREIRFGGNRYIVDIKPSQSVKIA